jgi:hypothetical protein
VKNPNKRPPYNQRRNFVKRRERANIRANLHGKPGGWKRALRNGAASMWPGADCGEAGL